MTTIDELENFLKKINNLLEETHYELFGPLYKVGCDVYHYGDIRAYFDQTGKIIFVMDNENGSYSLSKAFTIEEVKKIFNFNNTECNNKTAKIKLNNIKDPDGWHELITDLFWEDFQKEHENDNLDEDELSDLFYNQYTSKFFEYGEFGNIEIEVNKDLNIVGGKIIVHNK